MPVTYVSDKNLSRNKAKPKEEPCVAYFLGVENCFCPKCMKLKLKHTGYLYDQT